MNVEQHAEAILRALDIPLVNAPAILAAVDAAMVAGAEMMREAAERQMHAYGPNAWQDLLRLDPAAIVKGMGNG